MIGLLVGSVVLIAGGAWTSAILGSRWAGLPVPPLNPVELALGLGRGDVPWPWQSTAVAIGLALALVVLVLLVFVLLGRRRRKRSRVDEAAKRMARGRDLAHLTAKGAGATAARLGVTASPGLPIGKSLRTGQILYQGWEDVSVDTWGPRTGKSTSRAIPAILAAPGAVMATSNKRDLVDATRDVRKSITGEDVWVFDPQGIVDEPSSWWWNPLTYVTDEVKAQMLADIFISAGRDPNARTDAYFDGAASDLLAGLLLAAAVGGKPITEVYIWLTRPSDEEPVDLLREAGYPLIAANVAAVIGSPDKQRAGVFGSAQQTASFLTNKAATQWVVPGSGREFLPADFVRSRSTLYSLSKEGRGSAGPLVTALTAAVTEAAEELAKTQPGGRLSTPMVCVLDEAANVVRWRELPNLYSHYGSRGIVIMTILQSWSQGVEVWGRDGMRKLWSAANTRVYGGGVSEAEFLGELRQLIGTRDIDQVSISSGRGGRSRNRTPGGRTKDILDVAELAALPRGRAVLFASGTPPVLIETMPWMTGPYAEHVRASIAAHDPAQEPLSTVPAAVTAATSTPVPADPSKGWKP
ncbi:conjugative transfer gene complex protein [Actinomycetales bacterium JB111]|nr:conjugative transfer gene complex protein [Actinomycetales bacterium JB111]